MRAETNKARIEAFMESLGDKVGGPGRIYLTGGATAILHGWRETTIDIDLKADPEPPGFFEAIEPQLIRYPAINPPSFRKVVSEFCSDDRNAGN